MAVKRSLRNGFPVASIATAIVTAFFLGGFLEEDVREDGSVLAGMLLPHLGRQGLCEKVNSHEITQRYVVPSSDSINSTAGFTQAARSN